MEGAVYKSASRYNGIQSNTGEVRAAVSVLLQPPGGVGPKELLSRFTCDLLWSVSKMLVDEPMWLVLQGPDRHKGGKGLAQAGIGSGGCDLPENDRERTCPQDSILPQCDLAP